MSLTYAETFECPYCMTINDIEIDISSDVGQQQIVDCQICCQPIEVSIEGHSSTPVISVKQENE